jgi:cytosine permease
MGLLWMTMVMGFPTVLAGFDWYKQGFTLMQVSICVVVSVLILLAYTIPACYLGAKTGLSYTHLSKRTFGPRGSWLVAFNITWSSMCWYALAAVFLAQGLQALYHTNMSTAWMAGGLALLMASNNFFGFKGVANFAMFAAGPVMIAWVVYSFGLATVSVPAAVWSESAPHSTLQALGVVSAFVIGYAVWGNEADYWQFGKPSMQRTIWPLVASLVLGQIVFGVAGWLVAYLTHTTDPDQATAVMNAFTFGSATIIAAVVLTLSYVAGNDSLLFATDQAVENAFPGSRRIRVAILSVIASAIAVLLAQHANSFQVVASLSAIILPAATTIMVVEAFFPRKGGSPCFGPQHQTGWPAVLALLIGSACGIATGGFLPGTAAVGVPSLQGWLGSLVAYVVLRRVWR